VERYQQTLTKQVNQLPYELPSELEKAIADFVDYHNHRQYHKALDDVTPVDIIFGRREHIFKRREEVKKAIQCRRRDLNKGLKELAETPS
jgi:hypothetical protein